MKPMFLTNLVEYTKSFMYMMCFFLSNLVQIAFMTNKSLYTLVL